MVDITLEPSVRNIIKIIIVVICIVDDRYLHRITVARVWGVVCVPPPT